MASINPDDGFAAGLLALPADRPKQQISPKPATLHLQPRTHWVCLLKSTSERLSGPHLIGCPVVIAIELPDLRAILAQHLSPALTVRL